MRQGDIAGVTERHKACSQTIELLEVKLHYHRTLKLIQNGLHKECVFVKLIYISTLRRTENDEAREAVHTVGKVYVGGILTSTAPYNQSPYAQAHTYTVKMPQRVPSLNPLAAPFYPASHFSAGQVSTEQRVPPQSKPTVQSSAPIYHAAPVCSYYQPCYFCYGATSQSYYQDWTAPVAYSTPPEFWMYSAYY